MENPKVKTRKAFQCAIADMNKELNLIWQPIKDFVIINNELGLRYKATPNALMSNKPILSPYDLWRDVSGADLDTKEQRHLNKSLGLTKTQGLNKWYKRQLSIN